MSDYTHLPIDEMESIWSGGFKRARGSLGVTAFGLGVSDIPPNFDHIPKHVHTFDNQEEVYFTLAGTGWLEVDDERIEMTPDTVVRVGPTASRRGIAGAHGLRMLIVGGVPGEPYTPFEHLELGAPEPKVLDLPGVQAAHEHESSDDFTAMTFEATGPIEGSAGVTMFPVRRALGIGAFGVNVLDLQPAPESDEETGYPLHDHVKEGQEEVYVPIGGSGELQLDDERIAVAPGEMIRVGPAVKRKFFPGPDGLRFIAIGGMPGGVYEPPGRASG